MKTWMVVLALVAGSWWYSKKHLNFHSALSYAHTRPDASWAPAVDYYVGLAYYQRADYPKAQEAFTQLLTDHPTSYYTPRALLRLSEVAEEGRDWTLARDTLNRFLENFPDHPEKALAQRRYELIRNR